MFNTLIAIAGDIFSVVLGRRDEESAITKAQMIAEIEASYSHLAWRRDPVTIRGRKCHQYQLHGLVPRRAAGINAGTKHVYTLRTLHSDEDVSQAHEGGGIAAIAALAPKLEGLITTVENLRENQEKLAKLIANQGAAAKPFESFS